MLRPIAFVLAAAFAFSIAMPGQAAAATCAAVAVQARGEQSKFLWLAKTKARANWRRKVRATPGLGTAYANWARAANAEEQCFSGRLNHLCIFTGTPCRD